MIRFIKKFAVFFIAALVLTFIWFKTAGAAETLDAARLEALAKRLNDLLISRKKVRRRNLKSKRSRRNSRALMNKSL